MAHQSQLERDRERKVIKHQICPQPSDLQIFTKLNSLDVAVGCLYVKKDSIDQSISSQTEKSMANTIDQQLIISTSSSQSGHFFLSVHLVIRSFGPQVRRQIL